MNFIKEVKGQGNMSLRDFAKCEKRRHCERDEVEAWRHKRSGFCVAKMCCEPLGEAKSIVCRLLDFTILKMREFIMRFLKNSRKQLVECGLPRKNSLTLIFARNDGLTRHSELVARQAKNPHFKFKHFLQIVDSSPFFKRHRMTSGRAFLRTAPRYAFLAFAFALLLLTPNSAKAEQSGWFVGVQAGYGLGDRKRQLEATVKRTTNIQNNRYVFADEFGNINTIQKEERLDGITGTWTQTANEQWKGAGGDSKVNGSLRTGTILNTYKIVETFTFDPTDASTYKFTSGTADSVKGNITNYLTETWTSGITNEKDNRREMVELNDELKGLNAGLLAGYKHFFSTKLGLRVYGLLDYSYYKDSDTALQKMQAYNANLNLDVLYNLYDKNERIMGVFAGLSVGGAQYISSNTRLASDIDIGLNFGLRFGAGKHSIELFSRVGGLFVGAEKYSTSDTAYSSSALRLDSTTTSYVNYNSNSHGNALETIRICPTSETDCGLYNGNIVNGSVGYEKGNSTASGNAAYTNQAQYRYRVWRYQNTESYTKEVIDSTAGSGVIERYKQPYKIGIRYIYSF